MAKTFAEATTAVSSLTAAFAELERIFLGRIPEIATADAAKEVLAVGRKRKLGNNSTSWDELCKFDALFEPYRESTIEKWSRKTQVEIAMFGDVTLNQSFLNNSVVIG